MLNALQTMLYLPAQFIPHGGLHDFFEHHGSHTASSGDPQFDAFMVTLLIIVLCAVGVLFFCCPFLVVRVRRIRDLFWVIPSLNLALYLLSITLRTYPGGFRGHFQPPGLWFTILEILLLLLLSLMVASLSAGIMWLKRKLRGRKAESAAAPSGGPAPPPPIPKGVNRPPLAS